MQYYVIVRYKGSLSIEGAYKSKDAADKRADSITGGEVSIFSSLLKDPEKVLQEFRDEEVRVL